MKQNATIAGSAGKPSTDTAVQMGNAGVKPIKLANIYALCDVDSEYADIYLKDILKLKHIMTGVKCLIRRNLLTV